MANPSVQVLEEELSTPYPEDLTYAKQISGDIMVLGAGGKMGPTLVQRIHRALQQAGSSATVYAVSRFSNPDKRKRLEAAGATTIAADLLDETQLADLPDCPNIIYLVGMKFGATGQEDLTWAMNTYLPGRVAERFSDARIVAFSTGNVYPFVPVDSGGSKETDPPGPVGEYAQSCLGRERIFSHFSRTNNTPTCLLRLNYAVEPRYGVLYDIGQQVYAGEPVPLEMGHVNVLWQSDANSYCFRSLALCESPAKVLNITGPETLSVRSIANTFANHFDTDVTFSGQEAKTALLNNASQAHQRLGLPKVTAEKAISHIAAWIGEGGQALGKPTKFHVRHGSF